MTHDPTFWLLARAAGFTAYALLTASVLAGLVLKSRPFGTMLRPAAVTDLHRTLATLGLGALALHGLALIADSTIHVDLPSLVVPGLVGYRQVPVALGVLAADLMLLVVLSFRLRKRIGARNWRRLHWLTYLVFGAATAHGLLAGTDSARPWAFGLYLGAVGAVAAATAWRALVPPLPARPRGATT